MIKLMAFSGGGVRGCFTTQLLERLEIPYQEVYAMSGASTGAIIACGLAFGLSPYELTHIYLEMGPKIFARPFYRFKAFDRLMGAPYELSSVINVCKEVFGETRLGDLKKKVLIASYDLDAKERGTRQAKAKFFHNFDTTRHDKDVFVWEATASSVAAIAFFKPWKNRFTDGGIVENHSGLALLSQVLHPNGGVGADIEKVCQLSLGTGAVPSFMDSTVRRSWNIFDSLKTAIDSIAQSNVSVSDHVLQSVLHQRYFRLDQPLSIEVGLDEYEKMYQVLAEAQAVDVKTCQTWIDNMFAADAASAEVATWSRLQPIHKAS